nr:RNA-directed DNA polymerase, eukaryota [Tanacetum cinerariifolium]
MYRAFSHNPKQWSTNSKTFSQHGHSIESISIPFLSSSFRTGILPFNARQMKTFTFLGTGVCKGYGTVVDVYIPNRKFKAGKRFVFARFMRVDDVERLVSNPCTVWNGRMHMHANVVRFDRSSKPAYRPIRTETLAANTSAADTYAFVFKGGLWTMMEFSSLISKEKFLQHVGVASWFNSLSNAQPDFVSKERIVWMDIEGVPLHLWSHPTFTKIGSRWDELMELEESKDDLFAIVYQNEQEDNILEKFKIILRGKVFVIQAKELFSWVPIFQEDKSSDFYSDDESVRGDVGKENHFEQKSQDIGEDSDVDGKQDIEFKSGLEHDVDDNKVEDKVSSPSVGLNSRIMLDSSPIEDQMSSQETKMEKFSVMEAKYIWGNSNFTYLSSDSIGNSGDFNEVRSEEDRLGWSFNVRGANDFNAFIAESGLIDLHPEGYSFTHLSDHRPIILREIFMGYGATPFRLFHSWFTWDGFHNLVVDSWNGLQLEDRNDMVRFKKNLQGLKKAIREWVRDRKKNHNLFIKDTILKLGDIDKKLDCGEASEELLLFRMNLMQALQEKKSVDVRDSLQKAKVKRAIEGDENTKFFHGIINKKCAKLSISGVMVDGEWIVEPIRVKEAFRNHFVFRFHHSSSGCSRINFTYPNRLSQELILDLENHVSTNEICKAVWECGENKSPGPDGYTFELFRKFWSLVGLDFCKAIQCSAMALVIVNGSPTSEFQFQCGLKQGDPLAPYLFILVMESLHLSFSRVVEAGEWSDSNLDRILQVLHCFYLTSGLKINVQKSSLMGVGVNHNDIAKAACKLSYSILKTPLSNLGFLLDLPRPEFELGRILFALKALGIDLVSQCKKRMRNGLSTCFWEDVWMGYRPLKLMFPCIYALESNKLCTVAEKCHPNALDETFRRNIRDDFMLPKDPDATRWIKCIPNKVNVFAWKVRNDRLATKSNLIHRALVPLGVPGALDPVSLKGITLRDFMRIKLGNGENTSFWEDYWIEGDSLRNRFPWLYTLESCKRITVGEKICQPSLEFSFQRNTRGGVEQE